MLSILKNHSILYVEDEKEIQKNIAEYLESYFQTVYLASDGKEALTQYNTYNPDVILLDINLPLLDGLSVAYEIRKNNHDIKIIMLTAYTDTDKLLTATELNLTKYLVKPITPKLFKESLLLLSHNLILNPSKFLHFGNDCVWDRTSEILFIAKQPCKLTNKEHRLLKLLIKQKGTTVFYADIMLAVWEDAFERDISIDSVKNQIRHIRKKLPARCIDSIYGKGYMLK